MKDSFPYRLFIPRALDVSLYFVVLLVLGILLSLSELNAAQLGFIVLVLGLFQDYRQRDFYDKDVHEATILSRELVCSPLNEVAFLRRMLSRTNVVLIVFGTILTGFSAFTA